MIRPVADAAELATAFDVAGAAQVDDEMDHTDWRFDAVREAWPRDRDVDLVAEEGGELVGAVLSFRDGGGVRARILGVRADRQGSGVGAALLAGLASAARAAGDRRVYLGAVPAAVGFYERCGYRAAGTAGGGVTVMELLLD